MSATYQPNVPVEPMATYELQEGDRDVIYAEPMVTSKGRCMLTLQSAGTIEYDTVVKLRNWLSDYIGHYEATHKGGVHEVMPIPPAK